ncbi:serine/threonine-protein kinase SMG1-like [Forsythia ovata]|uniref:Serine/threonine-protein kinase SMG1-like n=1 Tax=Forsythia ovata TaxID=205694 RepID=A0ABD1PJ53_9LAMI
MLAALLTAVLPKDDYSKSTSTTTSTTATSAQSSEEGESSRLTAVTSLHRAILYPSNFLLVAHSASFLAQGFSQLLSETCERSGGSTAVVVAGEMMLIPDSAMVF